MQFLAETLDTPYLLKNTVETVYIFEKGETNSHP